MKQLTQEEAIAFADSEGWKEWSPHARAGFQLRQDCLCMPFEVFHEAVEKVLGRSVFTHEFGLNREGLIAELEGREDAPSFKEIINLIPDSVGRIVTIVVPNEEIA